MPQLLLQSMTAHVKDNRVSGSGTISIATRGERHRDPRFCSYLAPDTIKTQRTSLTTLVSLPTCSSPLQSLSSDGYLTMEPWTANVVVYPTPPPTTNDLTTKQRSVLLRRTKKIEQILGYPPHLVDTLNDAGSASASTGSTSSPVSGRSSSESSTDSLEARKDLSWLCSHGNRNFSLDSSPSNKGLSQIPLLRLTSKSLRLELTAMTNLPVTSTQSRRSEQDHEPSTISDSECSPKLSNIDHVPAFIIPTSHTHRKAKMDRVRKRLGSEVPYDVVFPEAVDRKEDSKSNHPEKRARLRKTAPTSFDRPATTFSSTPPSFSFSPSKYVEHRRTSISNSGMQASNQLWLIPECPDENSFETDGSGAKAGTYDLGRVDDRIGQGVKTLKRPPSYRKPPPPMLDEIVA